MRSRAGVALLAEYALRPFGDPRNRSQPAWRSATFAAEKGAHIGQYGVAQVEYHLKWLESKYADGETPGKPFGVGQTPQNLGNSLSAEPHRPIGHEEMDRLIGIPDVELWIERPQHLRIVTNWLNDEARRARTALRRLLHPMPNSSADGALVIEQQDWLGLLLHLWQSNLISRLEGLRYCRQDTRYGRVWSLDSSNFFPIEKHDQSRRAQDLVAVGEFLLNRGINSEDLLFGYHRLCHLLKDRLKRAAVCAAVRHELNRDRSPRF
jgi:hypothetical protein